MQNKLPSYQIIFPVARHQQTHQRHLEYSTHAINMVLFLFIELKVYFGCIQNDFLVKIRNN